MSGVSTPVRVAAFVAGLAATFAVAWGAGQLVGPLDTPAPAEHQQSEMTGMRRP